MADNDVLGLDLEQELGLHVPEPSGDTATDEVCLLDPGEPGVLVDDLVVRHHKALVLGAPRTVWSMTLI